jgi:class 3 adenylate cyclase/CheY-like chemotaxis protein
MLLDDVCQEGHDDLAADLQRIQGAGQNLQHLIDDLLQGPKFELALNGLDLDGYVRRLRHDLRTPLTQIIGYCDLWLEEADAVANPRFLADLARLKMAGQRLFASLTETSETSSASSKSAAELVLPPESPMSSARNERGKLLIVDDDELNREVLSRRLLRQGHQVKLAVNGRAALEILGREGFDLILLDMLMPEMNGMEFLRHLKADAALRYLPVIIISALDDLDSIAQCIQLGADDYLSRPFNSVLLQARIGACLEKKRLRDREIDYMRQIEREKERYNELLHVILPAPIVQELRDTNEVRPRRYEGVAVMFADIVGFTPYCENHPAEEVVTHLQQLVVEMEQIALSHTVQKIKTIGDSFMAAVGLLSARVANPVENCVRCAIAMLQTARQVPPHWQLRIGIHCGSVVAGLVGRRQYLFDLWGDTVNTAARVESRGVPDAITLSGAAWQAIADRAIGAPIGKVEVKGKGWMELVRFEGFRSSAT